MARPISCLQLLLLYTFIASLALATADPDPASIQSSDGRDTSSSSSSASSAAAAAAAAGSAVPPPPPPVVEPPPPIVPPGVGLGKGFGFNKHIDFSTGAGLGSLFGLIPGLGAGFGVPVPPPVGDTGVPVDGGLFGGGLPAFGAAQYIPVTWPGSALAAKGDLLFPIAIVVFAVIGVILTIKFLIALAVPFLAKKWAIADAFTRGKFGRAAGDDPNGGSAAHQAQVDDLTHKILPGVDAQHARFADHDSDGDGDSDFDG